MLSVLIPSYDTNVVPLVQTLHAQLQSAKVDFEIICIDNASKSEKCQANMSINKLANSRYIENKTDVGRSGLRNQLASLAKFKWLLFLDDDVMPVDSEFILRYREAMHGNSKVFCGGLEYQQDSKQKKYLRYRYGLLREQIDAQQRKKDPYKHFLASNLLIDKDLFERIRFNEKITKYGYEDLLFAKSLESEKIKIEHINNSVFHLGIDENLVFLEKSEQALQNMVTLLKKGVLLASDTQIFTTYKRFKRFGLLPVFRLFSGMLRKRAAAGSVLFFNFYRLSYLSYLLKKTK